MGLITPTLIAFYAQSKCQVGGVISRQSQIIDNKNTSVKKQKRLNDPVIFRFPNNILHCFLYFRGQGGDKCYTRNQRRHFRLGNPFSFLLLFSLFFHQLVSHKKKMFFNKKRIFIRECILVAYHRFYI